MIRYLGLALLMGLTGSQLVLRPDPGESSRLPPPIATLGYGPDQGLPIGLKPLQLADLTREAEVIAVGEVLENRCRWNADRTMIWTETRLRTEQVWKGEGLPELVILEPGGIIPPVGIKLSIETRYRPGERVLVFLTHDPLGQMRTLGAVQGRLEVVRRGGRDVVRIERSPRHLASEIGSALSMELLLSELHAVVQAAGKEGR